MSWRPPTLLDALNNDEQLTFETKSPVAGKLKYRCDCGSWGWAFQLVDCRGLSFLDMDFACDGCWTKWERNGTDIFGLGSDIQSLAGLTKLPKISKYIKTAWNVAWLTAHGAPQQMIDDQSVKLSTITN